MKKFIAFTLAETLIVMGIIGVVAALTLPNLNSTTADKEKVAKVKKIYSNLSDALGRAVAVYGPVDEWIINDTSNDTQCKRIFERTTEFMKTSKSNVSNYTAILADGTQIAFDKWNGCDGYYGDKRCGSFYIDLDGSNKGKNLYGHDVFTFYIINTGYVAPAGEGDIGDKPCSTNGPNEFYCTRWVVENDNMDYLKCYDKLKWGQVTTCK